MGYRTMPTLRRTTPVSRDMARRVSIVVAARNEERQIDGAIGTLLAQDYPDFEVIVVDDRSTDDTGPVLDALAGRWRRESERAAREGHWRASLRVLHLDDLPDGWLGKNRALHRGAELADGALILFTDADVMMRPDALARAVGLLERRGLDHLAVAPRIHAGGPWATMTVGVFLALFSAFFKPWKASDPESPHAMGIGAFNLVRADAYREIGGHADIALRPDDDLRLGRRLKDAGFRQAAAIGRDTVMIEWYPSLRAMARGFHKNAFAALDYRMAPLFAGTAAACLLVFWPVAALFLTEAMALRLNIAIVMVAVLSVWDAARIHGLPRWIALTYPLAALILLAIVWFATLRTLRSGTIEWRGTTYSLEALRKG